MEEYKRTGDLGEVTKISLSNKVQTTLVRDRLTVERVYQTFEEIASTAGHGSVDMKVAHLAGLLSDCTPIEGKYIIRTLMGILRLGIADYTVLDALSVAYTNDKANREFLERAYNISSDLGKVAKLVADNGLKGLEGIDIVVGNPIRPMLAERLSSSQEIIKKVDGKISLEYKLDGERLQIHVNNKQTEIFSRKLENITNHYPDVCDIMKELEVENMILEAEAVAIDKESGSYLPFQELMHRRRKYEIEEAVTKYPITVNFFDVLFSEGKNCMDMRYEERRELLEKIIKQDDFARLIPMSIIESKEQVLEVLENSINSGCEGLMLKHLDSTYRAGIRGSNWLKLKREYQNELGDSLDLVVVGAFFGKGRRTGKYGTLLLSTYNDEEDVFPSICKVGTGFTDESLDQLYQILSPKVTLKKNPRIVSEMEADVWFEPELVIEIVASEITQSPIHKTALDKIKEGTGLALRFPKFTGKIRTEKNSEDASTDEEVIALYKVQKKTENQE